MITAKKLYNKHLKLLTPDEWVSEKQMDLIEREAAIDAIQEVLDKIEVLNETIEADRIYEELSSEGEE